MTREKYIKCIKRGVMLAVLAALPVMALEITLRLLGIGGSLIYEESAECGYRLKPSQRFSTLGHPVAIDDRGFRGPIATSETWCVGCSVTYGGSFVRDTETFAAHLGAVNTGVPGWGIQNMARLVRTLPVGEIRHVVWTIPTGDAVRPFTKLKGHLISTNRRMWFRIEYLLRYVWYKNFNKNKGYPSTQKAYELNMAALEGAWHYLRSNDIDVCVAFLPNQREALGQRIAQTPFREMMQARVAELGIPYCVVDAGTNAPRMFQDGNHLSPEGHEWFAMEIKRRFKLP